MSRSPFGTHSSVSWQHVAVSHPLVKGTCSVQQHVQPVWLAHGSACVASHCARARGAIGDAAAAAIAKAKKSKIVFDMCDDANPVNSR